MSDALDKMAEKQAAYEVRTNACPHAFIDRAHGETVCVTCGVGERAWLLRRALLAESRVSVLTEAECVISGELARLAKMVAVDGKDGEKVSDFAQRVVMAAAAKIVDVTHWMNEWKDMAARWGKDIDAMKTQRDLAESGLADVHPVLGAMKAQRDAAVKRAEEGEALVARMSSELAEAAFRAGAAVHFVFNGPGGTWGAAPDTDRPPMWFVQHGHIGKIKERSMTRDAAIQKARELAGEKGGGDG